MDPEAIRNGLKDVFGSFDEFCQQISNTGGTLSARHGVVTPVTPVAARGNPFLATTSQSLSGSQSARLCLQKMTELVEPTPLQPPLPTAFNRELYNDPSSSTRSAPDESEVKRKKRKPKNPDSDSEFERDNRKRHADHVSKPSTSGVVHEEDAMKELFGDDTVKPSGSEKAVSPDSGVHSNEGLDDTDISSVINLMSNVLPMLSPVTERPQERERARREKAERREQREIERKRKEEEKEQRKKENRRREEQRETERKAIEEKEKKEAEESLRKEAEEKLRREAEERLKKEAEERLKKEAEERARREEGKLRKEAEEKQRREDKRREESRQRKEDERRKKLEERTRKEKEKQRKDEEENKQKREEGEERRRKEDETVESFDPEKSSEYQKDTIKLPPLMSQTQESYSRLTGTLSLQNLSNEKMTQLVDMSKRKNKKDNQGSRPSSPFVAEKIRTERDTKFDSGMNSSKKIENKLDIKSEIKNIPSPLSCTPRRDFHCASKECFPSKPILPSRTKDSDINQGDTYQELAKTKKRQADALDDYVKRLLLYLECMVYFSLSGQYYALHERSNSRQTSIMRDTCKLMASVTHRFMHHERLTSLGHHFSGRIRTLSIRAQSILTYHVFHSKMATALKAYKTIESSDDQCSYHNGDEVLPTPSPGENLSSESNPDATVTMPLEVFNCYKTQLKQLHGLMNAHKLWADSVAFISKSPTDTLFINSLESLCGALTIISPIDKMAIFVLTGVAWLREEYELELKRPFPSTKNSLKVQ